MNSTVYSNKTMIGTAQYKALGMWPFYAPTRKSMNYTVLVLILSLSITHFTFGQTSIHSRNLEVITIEIDEIGYLIKGYDQTNLDTLYFISLNNLSKPGTGFEKIKVGCKYFFTIVDVDDIDGHLPTALPNGYTLKLGGIHLKRLSRNGKTIYTTQYLSQNTQGLYIETELK